MLVSASVCGCVLESGDHVPEVHVKSQLLTKEVRVRDKAWGYSDTRITPTCVTRCE